MPVDIGTIPNHCADGDIPAHEHASDDSHVLSGDIPVLLSDVTDSIH